MLADERVGIYALCGKHFSGGGVELDEAPISVNHLIAGGDARQNVHDALLRSLPVGNQCDFGFGGGGPRLRLLHCLGEPNDQRRA